MQRQKKRNLFSRFPIGNQAESRVVKDFEDSGVQIDYKVVGLRKVESSELLSNGKGKRKLLKKK